ncbi:MAG: RNA polymerase sigma factor [Syntrophobacteraceae bacterium]|nr:RNA polymerase sigma factor [Syntrophobacteraceae bacterium]
MVEAVKDGPTDSEIITRVRGGKVDAFEAIVHRYSPMVLRIASRHVPRDSIEEVAQDAFVEAFRSLGSYAGKAPFGHWLSRIAVRCCYGFWRARRQYAEIPVSDFSDDSEEWMSRILATRSREAFEAESRRSEAAEILSHAMRGLSPRDRMVLTLVHLDGHTAREAADLLGWTVISVKVHAHRSRVRLRKAIQNLLEPRRIEP